MSNPVFKIKSDFAPAGDQPQAIDKLVGGIKKGFKKQTLLGVTGSGKTYTMANVIAQIGKPTLVIAHNKTLAAQLAQEYREFFPNNAVHYFVSYYDYYQPEAYMPITDTYIEKEAMINEEIDRLRHASTQAILTRKDVIIVASVSCIYNLGSPEEYMNVNIKIEKGQKISRQDLIKKLIGVQFERTNSDLEPGQIRAVGNGLEVVPMNEKIIYKVSIDNDVVSLIQKIDLVSRNIVEDDLGSFFIFPAKHFMTNKEQQEKAVLSIRKEADARVAELKKQGKTLEAERLKRRTNYDISLIREVGYCNGIENYSRHFSGKPSGEAPDTLLEYFPKKADGSPDYLTIIDESHVALPQIRGMQAGDASRKNTLVEYGFRLPSAKDNRPLRFDEFEERVGQTIYTSATPTVFEIENSEQVVEQVIRPTGLLDPEIEIRPITEKAGANKSQVFDFIAETERVIKNGGRVIATTLTKKMAEDLSSYLKDKGIKAEYLHSEIKTIDRIEILSNFRRGVFDCIVGVNLLREGLDLPEVEFIGILDADKEGFLRSETSLIQIIGRAARNVLGKVVLYADRITGSMERAIAETNRRRGVQMKYNEKHGITPKTIIKNVKDIMEHLKTEHDNAVNELLEIDLKIAKTAPKKLIKEKEKQMSEAVKILDFETAAIIRDEIKAINEAIGKQVKIEEQKEKVKKSKIRGMKFDSKR
jgi:excinuclease ABC subunit B